MIFSDDLDFRKTKRGLMITSSIAVLMVITGLPIEKINFGVVEFNMMGSRGIYWFLLAVLMYQFSIFRFRYNLDRASRFSKQNRDIWDVIKLGKYQEDLKSNLEDQKKDLNKVQKEIEDKTGWASEKIDYIVDSNNDIFFPKGSIDLEVVNELLEQFRIHKRKASILQSIIDGESIVQKNQIRLNILDYYFPICYSIGSCIALLIYLIFFDKSKSLGPELLGYLF